FEAGMRPETPCAVISRASTPEQQILRTTLSRLPQASGLPAPTLLVVGEVLRNAELPAAISRAEGKRVGQEIPVEISTLFAAPGEAPGLWGD
ncbi:MAG TPA: hypothetical protein VK466_00430, partial [Terriglobales bacterium]|nr:hypothetical protein [Terriglobales bacterium]